MKQNKYNKNVKTLLFVEPFYTVFTNPIYYYLAVYMELAGITPIQMGQINSVKTLIGLLALIISPIIINNLGRKKSIFIFDMISWVVVFFIWFISQSFVAFIIASALNGFYYVQVVAHNSLLTEDTLEIHRAPVLSKMYVLRMIFGISTTLFGFVITKLGQFNSINTLCLISSIAFLIMIVIRNKYLSETKAGIELLAKKEEQSVKSVIRQTFKSTTKIVKSLPIFCIVIINIAITFTASMIFYNVLFIKDVLKSDLIMTISPLFITLGSIIANFAVMPILFKRKENTSLIVASIIMVLSALCLIASSKVGGIAYLIYNVISGVGNVALMSYSNSILMNLCEDNEKADIYSAVMLVSTAFGIPSSIISGNLYEANPIFPFFGLLIIYIVSLLFAIILKISIKKEKNKYGEIL